LAHFHEWLTGTSVLYLKDEMPQIATVFTAHSTVLGNSIRANNLPLDGDLSQYNAEQLVNTFNVRAKHSLEKLTAEHADVFTTINDSVSELCHVFLGKSAEKIGTDITDYENSYHQAMEKALQRDNYTHIPLPFDYGVNGLTKKSKPDWKKIMVKSHIPDKLKKLHELSQNLWWCWDYEATNLFESINPDCSTVWSEILWLC